MFQFRFPDSVRCNKLPSFRLVHPDRLDLTDDDKDIGRIEEEGYGTEARKHSQLFVPPLHFLLSAGERACPSGKRVRESGRKAIHTERERDRCCFLQVSVRESLARNLYRMRH